MRTQTALESLPEVKNGLQGAKAARLGRGVYLMPVYEIKRAVYEVKRGARYSRTGIGARFVKLTARASNTDGPYMTLYSTVP